MWRLNWSWRFLYQGGSLMLVQAIGRRTQLLHHVALSQDSWSVLTGYSLDPQSKDKAPGECPSASMT